MADAALRAQAARQPLSAWRAHLPAVLAATSVADGAAAARAILRAHPAGLGDAPEADVNAAEPAGRGFRHTLLEAMALAADRDQIARQYVSGFATVLGLAASLADLRRAGASREDAVTATFVRQLAAQPDTHIARKHGAAQALAVTAEVAGLLARLALPPNWTPARLQALAGFHDRLLALRINPGSSADLLVAAVFAVELDDVQSF